VKNIGNMNQMLKMAQRMQQDLARTQEEMGEKVVEASAGGGAVTATVNGRKELLALKIEPEVVTPDDVEMLEDMIVAAINQAMRQAEEMMAEAMAKITGGIKLPGMN
jgi:DNA-binding YbaB/EbfC family protein